MKNVPDITEKLVENFERDIVSLKSAAYNETELRADFVNPFWKALGWDMTNEKGYAMQCKHIRLPNVNAPHDKQTIQRQIDATDRQIDKLVYELYGLTEEEIRVVENSVLKQ
jgi:hypothetical protein